jgi:hypothetical protein
VEFRRSAFKHGLTDAVIEHAVEHWLVWNDDIVGADPPRILILGPDFAGNLLEILAIEDVDGELVVFHAMPARPVFLKLLG